MALCLSGVISGTFTVDQHRSATEGMHPVAYMATRYFERWMFALEHCLVEAGALTPEEIEDRLAAVAGDPDAPLPEGENEELAGRLKMLLAYGIPEATLDAKPRFRAGDEVKARVIRVEPGQTHTRMPGYVQGKAGVIEIVQPPEPLADAVVAGEGMRPEYVYAVRFRASDLWADTSARDSVTVDLWESYIEPVGEDTSGEQRSEDS